MTQDKHWFEIWFDSIYYPILYQNRDYTEGSRFIENLIEKLDPNKNVKILDMACGEGRHSVHLNKLGFDVTGFDLSERSIKLADKYNNDRLKFSIDDMRSFELNEKFDVILNLFTSFGYFNKPEENLSVLSRVKSHLNEKGIIVIDFFNAKKVVGEMKSHETKILDGIEFKISKKIEDQHIIKRIDISDNKIKEAYFEKVQLITLNDFENMLETSGFSILEMYGDYNLNEFNEQHSNRLIIFATQKKTDGSR